MPNSLLSTEARCGPTPDRYFMSRVVKSNMSPKGRQLFSNQREWLSLCFPGYLPSDKRACPMPRPPSIIRKMRSIRLLISLFQQIRIKHLRSLYQLVCVAADSFTSFANQMTHRLHHIRHTESPPASRQPGSNNGYNLLSHKRAYPVMHSDQSRCCNKCQSVLHRMEACFSAVCDLMRIEKPCFRHNSFQ